MKRGKKRKLDTVEAVLVNRVGDEFPCTGEFTNGSFTIRVPRVAGSGSFARSLMEGMDLRVAT